MHPNGVGSGPVSLMRSIPRIRGRATVASIVRLLCVASVGATWGCGQATRSTVVPATVADASTALVPDPASVRFEVVSGSQGPLIGADHPDAKGIAHGIEGGTVLAHQGSYHLFTSEQYADPKWVAMRLGYWTSPDGEVWQRRSTIFESSGDFTGADPRGALWSPMPTYDETSNRWLLTYVGYRAKPDTADAFYRNHDGRIYLARSTVAGPEGLGGPYEEVGVILASQPEVHPWEGLQGTDSFFPYRVQEGQDQKGRWLAFYGSAQTQNKPVTLWAVGLAEAPSLTGPWKRTRDPEPVGFGQKFVENPIVSRLDDGTYIAIMDAWEDGFGYGLSRDGVHWSKMAYVTPTARVTHWWHTFRTPLCLIPSPAEADTFTVFFTATARAPGENENTGVDSMGRWTVKRVRSG